MKQYLAGLAFLLTAETVLSATESSISLLAQIPAIPNSVSQANCDFGKQVSLQADIIAAEQFGDQARAALMPLSFAGAVTDDQGDALSRMTEEAVTQCIMDVSMAANDLIYPHLEALKQQLNNLQQNKIREDDRCGSGIGMDVPCHNRVIQDYTQHVTAEANDFLIKVKAPFDQWRHQARQCMELREQAADGVLQSGMKGPFDIQARAILTQNYSLVKAVADAYTELCDHAVIAVQNLDYQ